MITNKNEIQHFNFELENVLDFSRKSAKVEESLGYLQKILRLKKNNKTILDHSLGCPDYDFEVEVKAEIKRLKNIPTPKTTIPIEPPPKQTQGSDKFKEYDTEITHLNNQLNVANTVVKRYNKIRYAKIDYSKFKIGTLQDAANKTRKKNGKLNYSGIGNEIGVSDITAKRVCNSLSIT